MTSSPNSPIAPPPGSSRDKTPWSTAQCTRLLLLTTLLTLTLGAATARGNDADLVLLGGEIVTLDDITPTAEAIAITGDRIARLGSRDVISTMIGPDTRVIELEGAFVMPGFIEGHAHFVGLGEARMNLDLMHVRSWDEVIALVAEAVAGTPPGTWIRGRGWHQEKWDRAPDGAIEGFPTHDALSAISPDHPVVLTHASGHASFANRAAMDRSGISPGTLDPPGGEILRNADGAPIGIFRETAQRLIGERRGVVPESVDVDRAIDLAVEACLEHGITSFQDAGSSFDEVDALARRATEGTLGVRVWAMVREPTIRLTERLGQYRSTRGIGHGFFTVGGLKRSLDGALGARGAWLLEPYSDSPGSTGLNTATIEDVTAVARLAREHNLQLCVHAIGDRANRETLDLFERVTTDRADLRARRWRIEHAQHLHPQDIPRFGALGVIASMQGVHCTSDGPWVEKRLGPERARKGAYVWRDLIDSGAIVTNGTDAPVESIDPLASYLASVTRRTADGSVFHGEQAMTRIEALRSYTIDAAFASFEENVKGSLTPGKYADITIISSNLLTAPETELRSARVLYTIVAGQVGYEAAPQSLPMTPILPMPAPTPDKPR